LFLQYLPDVVGRSEVGSTERSLIVSLSVGKYNAGLLKGISPYCPFLSLPECEMGAQLCYESQKVVNAWEKFLLFNKVYSFAGRYEAL
jgi:hypothetical protein